MGRLKIIRKNEKRRETKGILFVTLLFLILFPYVISGFSDMDKETIEVEEKPGQIWVVEEKIWGSKKILLEEYLIGMMAASIPVEYHEEALKAQAIILRSFAMTFMEKKDGKKIIRDSSIKDFYFTQYHCKKMWAEDTQKNLDKLKNAVEATGGIVIIKGEDIINPPFCRMTNGNSRDITEYVVHKEQYEYMKSIKCEEDEMATDAVQYMEISQKELEHKIKKYFKVKDKKVNKIILYKDSLNYVKEVQIGEKRYDGEEFRQALGLASSCYSLEKIDHIIEIQTRGIGHGYGFSQYTAHQMAVKGKDYTYLIDNFFCNITLKKI